MITAFSFLNKINYYLIIPDYVYGSRKRVRSRTIHISPVER